MQLILGAILTARVLLAWALGLAILYGLGLSGLGGPEPALWMLKLLLAASVPILILTLAACFVYPRALERRPTRLIVMAVLLAAAIGFWMSGLLGAFVAVFACLPAVLLFLILMVLLPSWRLGVRSA